MLARLVTGAAKMEEHREVKDCSYESNTPLAIISHHLNAVPPFCLAVRPSVHLQPHSGRLLPYRHQTDQTADGAGNTDDAVVKVDPSECRGGDSQIAQVGDELQLAGRPLTVTKVSNVSTI